MITIQDLYNISDNKIANEAQKTLIRNNMPGNRWEREGGTLQAYPERVQ